MRLRHRGRVENGGTARISTTSVLGVVSTSIAGSQGNPALRSDSPDGLNMARARLAWTREDVPSEDDEAESETIDEQVRSLLRSDDEEEDES